MAEEQISIKRLKKMFDDASLSIIKQYKELLSSDPTKMSLVSIVEGIVFLEERLPSIEIADMLKDLNGAYLNQYKQKLDDFYAEMQRRDTYR